MNRLHSGILVLVGGLLLGGCKKDEPTPQVVPVPASSASATSLVADTPTPTSAAPTPSTAPSAAEPPPAPPSTAAAPAHAGGPSIDACCKALNAVSTSGKSADSKQKSAMAARICQGIDKLVKSGKTSHAAAMTQIKSALGGVSVPPECN